jgi:hypothetical protein
MTKPLPWGGRFALLLLLPAGLLPLLATVRRSAPGPSSDVPVHRFQDWSTRHAIYSQTGTSAALEAARTDPRAIFRWREVEQREAQQRQAFAFREFRGRRIPRRFPLRAAPMQRDWSINLGTAGTAPAMYPAKFSFNVKSTPDCTKDFVVFPVNAVGTATQPNIVAFNNLYSGSAALNGSNGFCNRAVTGNDTGIAATVLWSYNVHAIAAGGAVSGALAGRRQGCFRRVSGWQPGAFPRPSLEHRRRQSSQPSECLESQGNRRALFSHGSSGGQRYRDRFVVRRHDGHAFVTLYRLRQRFCLCRQ